MDEEADDDDALSYASSVPEDDLEEATKGG